MKRLEDRHWLPYARLLALGEDTKEIHIGCGDRPSLFIKHDEEGLWAYCHRCRATARYVKEFQRIRTRAPEKSGWYPNAMLPFLEAVVENPRQFEFVLVGQRMAQYVSLLTYAPDTMRVYLPDTSKNFLGLDVTGSATARWYAPTRRALAYHVGSAESDTVLVTGGPLDYLRSVRQGESAILAMNPAGRRAAVALLSTRPGMSALADKKLPKDFMRELRAVVPITMI